MDENMAKCADAPAVQVPVRFDAQAPDLHALRYAFEPEGMSKAGGLLVTPELGVAEGTAIFSAPASSEQEYRFRSMEIPARECDYVLTLDPGNNRSVIRKLRSSFVLRHDRRSNRRTPGDGPTQSAPPHKAVEQHDAELNELEKELFDDM